MNNWYNIYNNRNYDKSALHSSDKLTVFKELKKIDGFDLSDSLTADSLIRHFEFLKDNILKHFNGTDKTVYEVGCGSGADLFMFEKEGFVTGGIDYADNMIAIAETMLTTDDLTVGEASSITTEKKYDFVISDSVFQYFDSYDYAKNVIEKMIKKAKHSVAILDVLDNEKKDAFYLYRRSIDPEYDKKYEGLGKLFYDKKMFIDIANENNMNIEFIDSAVDAYWNNRFVFNCFIYHNR